MIFRWVSKAETKAVSFKDLFSLTQRGVADCHGAKIILADYKNTGFNTPPVCNTPAFTPTLPSLLGKVVIPGANTGNKNINTITISSFSDARGLGFQALDTLTDYQDKLRQ